MSSDHVSPEISASVSMKIINCIIPRRAGDSNDKRNLFENERYSTKSEENGFSICIFGSGCVALTQFVGFTPNLLFKNSLHVGFRPIKMVCRGGSLNCLTAAFTVSCDTCVSTL